ncbi:transporter substrate-binding domain-containing protein [Paraglaciecola sp.]|uniref:substrate-binding periplasmic protein n=1 Tax=Paraglaciecola sp. TaxID=1920173 RepID=UPI0030F42A31
MMTCLTVIYITCSSGTKAAEKLTVAFGEVLAPWVLAESNKGIIIEIFESAVRPMGFEVEHVYLPYARRINAYQNGLVDVTSDINLNTIQGHALKGFFSDIAYTYENFAFSLHKRHFNFSHMNELKKHSLLSWQDAAIHLGAEYAQMVKSHAQYSETFDQSNQVKMLFLERYDVVQMDAQIFAYYRAKIAGSDGVDTTQRVDSFPLFGDSPNGFMFRTKKMRDDFNVQLKKLKQTGEYAEIFARYTSIPPESFVPETKP